MRIYYFILLYCIVLFSLSAKQTIVYIYVVCFIAVTIHFTRKKKYKKTPIRKKKRTENKGNAVSGITKRRRTVSSAVSSQSPCAVGVKNLTLEQPGRE